jgi:hypothetical protein
VTNGDREPPDDAGVLADETALLADEVSGEVLTHPAPETYTARLADRKAAVNLGLIRRLALSLVKRHEGKGSVARKRYAAALDTDLLEEILGLR